MAKARKLPSGAWQTRATRVIGGKKVTKSFTVHPKDTQGNSKMAKQKSELLAREWQIETDDREVQGKKISDVMEEYIQSREKLLSPSTIYDYRRIVKFFDSIKDLYVDDIKTSDIQALINEWSVSLKSKTIHNRITFLLSALYYSDCDRKFRLRYPQKNSKKVVAPDIEDVQMLMRNASDEFRPVIALAAFGSLRRGEICGLKEADISRDMCLINIHSDVVRSDEGWQFKPFPKTSDSIRTIKLPKFIIDMLPVKEDPDAFIFDYNPNMITHHYDRLRTTLGFDFTFHSLRHYAASFRSDLGIPSKYIEELGGWKEDSSVLKNVYDNTLSSSRKKYTDIANRFIEENFDFSKEKRAN